MDKEKTLVCKNGYLFLINDSCKELELHCNNLNIINQNNLLKYEKKNFLLIVFPNKCLIYKNHLPNQYDVRYRPSLEVYKKHFGNKVIDTYNILIEETDTYYKTDTHINLKGSYLVYKYFIEKVNEIYGLNLEPKKINILNKKCILTDLSYGIGDLLWHSNLGEQIVEDKTDTFYFSEDIEYLYNKHIIKKKDDIRILNKELIDINEVLEGTIMNWEVLSKYILYKKNNCKNKYKVLIFYDSFLTPILDLYLHLFGEVYMIKEIYNKKIINIVNPNYVFEFRVERFLF